ncbi:MAG: hypothetical protein HFI68_07155 [Lachnospiraceae bacterium]|nr:hypothetical protein [Lachnospiraceae bacterium]
MNDYWGTGRKRGRSLLIVEGNHEKNKLFRLIFQCFPEIHIDMDDIWIYGTNIYVLYGDIVKEYGSGWSEDDTVGIDLPFIISKKQHPAQLCYKRDFINIILVFDYERHDTNFSEEKILELQNYFVDGTDMGKLYINYPMIESYQHLRSLPDEEYVNRKVSVSLRPGKEYKALVRDETVLSAHFGFTHKVEGLLKEHFEIQEEQIWKRCYTAILNISNVSDMDATLVDTLQNHIGTDQLRTAKYQFKDLILKQGYIQNGQTYWEYMRDVFKQIIYHNIRKAKHVQSGYHEIEEGQYKECFEQLDLAEILKIQNLGSRDAETGFIWVLNTCVFFVAEYNFGLVV